MGKKKNGALKTVKIVGGIALIILGVILLVENHYHRFFISLIAIGGGVLWNAFVSGDDEEAESEQAQPEASQSGAPARKGSSIKKVISWIVGIIVAVIVILCIIGLFADDEDDDQAVTESITLTDYDENQRGYLLGGTEDDIMLLSLDMTSDMKIKSEDVYSYTPGVEEPIRYSVENSGPGSYYLRAEGNPGVWGAQTLTLKSKLDSDGAAILRGTFTDTDGSESKVELVIMQPGEDERYYLATIGESQAFFTITSNYDGSIDGLFFTGDEDAGDDPIAFSGSMEGRDEYGDPFYTLTGDGFTMKVTWWSNGGEEGFTGQYKGSNGTLPINAYSIY